MSIMDKLKDVVGMNDESTSKTHYRCPECERDFTSYKRPDRSFCTECMNQDVEVLEQ
jgi:protein-arginine kinase activator protein McsA